MPVAMVTTCKKTQQIMSIRAISMNTRELLGTVDSPQKTDRSELREPTKK
jgi:hypothetical protein